MTVYSTKKYCREMLQLCENKNRYENCPKGAAVFDDADDFSIRTEDNILDRYLSKVIDYEKEGIIKQHYDELEKESPFPSELKGYLRDLNHGGVNKVFQPLHLMYKVPGDCVRDDKHSLTFEFLIEYGLVESDVGIYYGIKAISDEEKSTPEFVEYVQKLSLCWFKMIQLENAKNKDFILNKNHASLYRSLNFTNNVSDGTFWIAWGRKTNRETMDAVKRNLQALAGKNFKKLLAAYDKYQELADSAQNKGAELEPIDELIADIKRKIMRKNEKERAAWLDVDSPATPATMTRSEIDGIIEKSLGEPPLNPDEKLSVEAYVMAYINDALQNKNLLLVEQKDKRAYRFGGTYKDAMIFFRSLYNPGEIVLANLIAREVPPKCTNVAKKIQENKLYIKRSEGVIKQRIRIDWKIINKIFRFKNGKRPDVVKTENMNLEDITTYLKKKRKI